MRAGQIFLFFSGECLRLAGEKLPSVRPGVDVEITREPIGVVGLITPWNFPIAIPAWKIAPALAYGNCVVFKPADLVPGSAHALSEIIVRAGVPAGRVQPGDGPRFRGGRGHAEEPGGVRHLVYRLGRRPAARSPQTCIASDPMKKVQLEMGGKNPLVVLDDADLKVAVECAVNGAFFSTGQRCTASSRLIVTEGIHDRFVDAVSERMQGLVSTTPQGRHPYRPGRRPEPARSGPGVYPHRPGRGRQACSRRRIAESRNARLLSGAGPVHGGDNRMRIAREEIFGPVATVTRARIYDEALEIANDTPFGLSAGICTTSLKHAGALQAQCEAGMVMVNLPTAGVDYHVPFGGRKGSSYGPREQGRYAQEFYTTVKTAYTADGN